MGVAGQIRRAGKQKDEIEPVGRSTEPVTTDGAHDPVSLVRNVRVSRPWSKRK